MRTKFKTETGSIYLVDTDAMTWERLSNTGVSPIRTETGPLTEVPELVVGRSAELIGPPFVPNAVARAIITSRIVEILPCE